MSLYLGDGLVESEGISRWDFMVNRIGLDRNTGNILTGKCRFGGEIRGLGSGEKGSNA